MVQWEDYLRDGAFQGRRSYSGDPVGDPHAATLPHEAGRRFPRGGAGQGSVLPGPGGGTAGGCRSWGRSALVPSSIGEEEEKG